MKRRTFVSAIASLPLSPLALSGAANASTSSSMSAPATAAEREPFIAIAKAKGVPITKSVFCFAVPCAASRSNLAASSLRSAALARAVAFAMDAFTIFISR